jgi:hypothetical protein
MPKDHDIPVTAVILREGLMAHKVRRDSMAR